MTSLTFRIVARMNNRALTVFCCSLMLLPMAAKAQNVASQSNLTLILSAISSRYDDTLLNPDNQIVQVPDQVISGEIRPNLQLRYEKLDLVLRPKLVHNHKQFNDAVLMDGRLKKQSNETKFRWQELYANWQVGEPMLLTWGIQNFQWGPAEAINASNPIFRDGILSRTILFEPDSKHVVRLSRNFGQAFNLMAIVEAEPVHDNEPKPFQAQALLKGDYSMGTDSVGLVLFGQEGQRSGFGEYASFTFFDSLSLFFDASHRTGSQVYVPVSHLNPVDPQNPIITFEQSGLNRKKIYSLGVVGARYEWENSDARIEWVGYEEGYSEQQFNDLYKMLDGLDLGDEQSRAAFALVNQNNRLFPGRNHVLFSIRRSNLFDRQDTTAYFRYFASLQDASAQVYGHIESPWGDQWWLFAAGGFGIGKKNSEMRNYVKHMALVGIKEMW